MSTDLAAAQPTLEEATRDYEKAAAELALLAMMLGITLPKALAKGIKL